MTTANDYPEYVDDTRIPDLKITCVNNYIYLGSYNHSFYETNDFKKLCVDVIVNCASIDVQYNPEMRKKYTIYDYPFTDDKYATLLESLDDANDKIHAALKAKKRIYIHCVRGMSRAPAVLIYYLMSHKKFKYADALRLLCKLRPIIDINPAFESELQQIEQY